ncbi:hypothetical protein N431DRAFT_469839 [Stipitochalara longipes BDJ]|nr:hypothetical protein N431DRAFT_469839 [Stipitochalara longipes BDJ]
MPQYANTPSVKSNSSKMNQFGTNSQLKTNAKDKESSQRMKDFLADPGPVPFRRETVAEAKRYMADRIREFDNKFEGGNMNNR